jgi:hypothetical protein
MQQHGNSALSKNCIYFYHFVANAARLGRFLLKLTLAQAMDASQDRSFGGMTIEAGPR